MLQALPRAGRSVTARIGALLRSGRPVEAYVEVKLLILLHLSLSLSLSLSIVLKLGRLYNPGK